MRTKHQPRVLMYATTVLACGLSVLPLAAQEPISEWTQATAKLPFVDGVAWRAAVHRERNILIFEHGYRHAYVGTAESNGDILAWRSNGLYPQTLSAGGGSPFIAPVVIGDTLITADYPQSWLARLAPDGTVIEWSQAPSLNSPVNGYQSIATHGNRVYVVGGVYGPALKSVQRAELLSDSILSSWIELTPLPTGVAGAQLQVINGHLYVFGGEGSYGDTSSSRDVYRAVINADGSIGPWEPKGATQSPRPHAAHLFANETIYTIGGGVHTAWSESSEYVTAGHLGDLAATRLGPDYPILKINGMGAAMAGRYGYIIGGNVADYATAHTDLTYFTRFRESESPLVTDLDLNPGVVAVNSAPVRLSAKADDSGTGGSDIASGEYRVSGGAWSPMNATDSLGLPDPSGFNAPVELMASSIGPFSTSGVLDVCVRATDSDGNTSAGQACILLPVYDPSDGFVTGGGAVDSAAGADKKYPTATGPAQFGFVSKYLPGRNVPTGNLQFHFKAGDLTFASTAMEWLVVTGEPRARFKGVGVVNGTEQCMFEVDAWDASFGSSRTDAFGLKLFACGGGTARYELAASPLIRGSIVVHKK